MASLNPLFLLAGRVLLAGMFIFAGYSKITGFAGTQQYMESQGVPGLLLPLVILVELGGGLAVLLGWMTRWSALALAAFTLLAAILFHADFGDRNQMIHFMKNLTVVGGFLVLAAAGPGPYSIDRK